MSQSGVPSWSQTSASNATADPTINWSEGQAPSSVNDSARAMMAALAKYRDDNNGKLFASGTSTALSMTTNTGYASLSDLVYQELTFLCGGGATNDAGITLNVDGLGARPIMSADGTALPAGVLVFGSVYTVTYYTNNGGEFILHHVHGNPYNIPVGASVEYWGASVPNSSFVFPYGQAISRTTYATCFSLFGTTYGTGDGTTTFNIPDLRGRVVAGKDDMGGSVSSPPRLTATYFGAVTGAVGTTLGGVGGLESHTLTTAQLASHNHTATSTDSGHTHGYTRRGGVLHQDGTNAATVATQDISDTTASGTANITTTINNTGGGGAHNNVQPTIICNKILRII